MRWAPLLLLIAACDSRDPDVETPEPQVRAPETTPDAATAPPETAPRTAPPDTGPLAANDSGAAPDHSSSLLREVRNNVETVAQRLARERYRELLAIEHLLSRGEVREVTGYTGTLARTELEGQEPGETYNAFRLAAEETYGFGLQVWKFRDAVQATGYFGRLQETYVVTGDAQVGDASGFAAELGGIRQIVFVAPRQSSVVAVSCDDQVCPAEDPLISLAERVYNRL